MKSMLTAALCAALLTLNAAAAAAGTFTFHVAVDTSALAAAGAPPKPFALDFQLLGGDPASNSVSIFNIDFGGGSATSAPAATAFGLASGDLAAGVVSLADDATHFFNEFYQGFNPGNTLTFDVLLTSNVNAPTPDAFSFSILDQALANIPTTGLGDTLLLVNLNTASLNIGDVQTFRSTGLAGVSVTATPVPEPASLVLIGTGLVGVAARIRRRRIAA